MAQRSISRECPLRDMRPYDQLVLQKPLRRPSQASLNIDSGFGLELACSKADEAFVLELCKALPGDGLVANCHGLKGAVHRHCGTRDDAKFRPARATLLTMQNCLAVCAKQAGRSAV
jgi:hypothetical protein